MNCHLPTCEQPFVISPLKRKGEKRRKRQYKRGQKNINKNKFTITKKNLNRSSLLIVLLILILLIIIQDEYQTLYVHSSISNLYIHSLYRQYIEMCYKLILCHFLITLKRSYLALHMIKGIFNT